MTVERYRVRVEGYGPVEVRMSSRRDGTIDVGTVYDHTLDGIPGWIPITRGNPWFEWLCERYRLTGHLLRALECRPLQQTWSDHAGLPDGCVRSVS